MKRAVLLIIVLVLLVIQSMTATAQSSEPEATATMEAIRATEAAQLAVTMQKELPSSDLALSVKLIVGLAAMGGMALALMRSECVRQKR